MRLAGRHTLVRALIAIVSCSVLPLSAADGVDPEVLARLLSRHKAERREFQFALIGDQQYGAEGERKWPALLASLNQDAAVQFVVHDGDFKNGSSLCSDQVFRNRLESFQASEHPFIFTPGDNEWTDCHRANNGSFEPLERLALLRQMFFPAAESLGKNKMQLTIQSGEDSRFPLFSENALWTVGNVVFATVHVVGSNNNYGRTAEQDREANVRNSANLHWMRTAFSLARDGNFGGVVLIIQANPNFELPSASPERTGFNDTLRILAEETQTFARPVILVHGDSHYFRIDKPLLSETSRRRLENFTRVETFGAEDVHWLRAKVNPADPNLFAFEQVLVTANLVAH